MKAWLDFKPEIRLKHFVLTPMIPRWRFAPSPGPENIILALTFMVFDPLLKLLEKIWKNDRKII